MLLPGHGRRRVNFDDSSSQAAGSVSRISSSIAGNAQRSRIVVSLVNSGSSCLCWREQRLFDDHQISQGEQGVELCRVLGQPAVA